MQIWQFDFLRVLAERSQCQKLVNDKYPVSVDSDVQKGDVRILDGHFRSPLDLYLPDVMPKEVRTARFQLVVPTKWPSDRKPVCIHMAGTGDHFFWRRRTLMARPLIKEYGIGSLILENPFYGVRKPKGQLRSSLRHVNELFVMGGGLILEGLVMLHWLEKRGFGPLGLTGISMGGHMASLTATNWHKPIPLIPCLSWSSATPVFTEGVLSGAIPWPVLVTQYLGQHLEYEQEIKRKLHKCPKTDAHRLGQEFAWNYPESVDSLKEMHHQPDNSPNKDENSSTSSKDNCSSTSSVDNSSTSSVDNSATSFVNHSSNSSADTSGNVPSGLSRRQHPDNDSRNKDNYSATSANNCSATSSKDHCSGSFSGDMSGKVSPGVSSGKRTQQQPEMDYRLSSSSKDYCSEASSDVSVKMPSGVTMSKTPSSDKASTNCDDHAAGVTSGGSESPSEASLEEKTERLERSESSDEVSRKNTPSDKANSHANFRMESSAIEFGQLGKIHLYETLVRSFRDLISRRAVEGTKTDAEKMMRSIREGKMKIATLTGVENYQDLKQEALEFMRGVMDVATFVGNFSTPVDPSLVIVVTALRDAYIPRKGVPGLNEVWPNIEVRYLDCGHIAAVLFKQAEFRKAINDAFNKYYEKYEQDQDKIQEIEKPGQS